MLPKFFYSKTYKKIMLTIFIVELIIILFTAIFGTRCKEKGCWKEGKYYGWCWEHMPGNSKSYTPSRSYKKSGQHTNNYSSSKSSASQSKRAPSYSTYSYNGNSYSKQNDPYDVSNYDDPDDFADDWADEFGDGDYDSGYDDAYDYWESNN